MSFETLKRLVVAWGVLCIVAILLLVGWNAHAMVNYNEVLEASDGATIRVLRAEGSLLTSISISMPPPGPSAATWSRLSDTERDTLIELLTNAVP